MSPPVAWASSNWAGGVPVTSVDEQMRVDRRRPHALPVIEVGRHASPHRRRQWNDLITDEQTSIMDVGGQQILQLLDADGVERQQAGEGGGGRGVGVQVLTQLVQLYGRWSGRVRFRAVQPRGRVDEDELAALEDAEDRAQRLRGGVVAHRVGREHGDDVVAADLSQGLMACGNPRTQRG